MGSRRYTGFDGNAPGQRAGLERMVDLIGDLSGRGLWNNGTWGPRLMRGKSTPSIHGTGRAVDLSWRGGSYPGYGDYAKVKPWINLLTANAEALGIEMILDYQPGPYGAGYKCDRDEWLTYTSYTIDGAPGGDWIHVEVSPAVADDPGHFDRLLPQISKGGAAGSIATREERIIDVPAPEDFPGHSIGVGHNHQDEVRAIQNRVGVAVDGDFGPITLGAVNAFQLANGLKKSDGVGKQTWNVMFGVPKGPGATEVMEGEGWSQVAARLLGDGTRWRELAGLNGGENRVLFAGDVLQLPDKKRRKKPAGQPDTTKVEQGEGWFQIAQRALGSGSRWTELAGLNGGENRVLHVGDELTLP